VLISVDQNRNFFSSSRVARAKLAYKNGFGFEQNIYLNSPLFQSKIANKTKTKLFL